MPASYTVNATTDADADTLTVSVTAFVAPATTAAVFKLADAGATNPAYLGVATVAEIATLPTSDPGGGDEYLGDTVVMDADGDASAALDGVQQALVRLAKEVDQQAAGLQVVTFTVSATGVD